jgi:hypothetical protein
MLVSLLVIEADQTMSIDLNVSIPSKLIRFLA